jgi:hypothetical protein
MNQILGISDQFIQSILCYLELTILGIVGGGLQRIFGKIMMDTNLRSILRLWDPEPHSPYHFQVILHKVPARGEIASANYSVRSSP